MRLGRSVREAWRRNRDWESYVAPLFYLTCRQRFASMGRDEVRAYQSRRARQIVRYAVRYSPFFARLYQGYDLDDVWSLPCVDKRVMMRHLGEYNTLGLGRQEILDFCARVERTRDFGVRLKGVNVGMSSGTSGNRGVELTTRREEAYLRAAFLARYPFPRNKINMAFILRVSSPAFQLHVLGHRLTYVSPLQTEDAVLAQLAELDPNVLAAPPSMLRILARQVERGKLALSLLQVVSFAEVLYAEDREYLSSVFGCPVYEIYKASEGSIAISCRAGNLHINEDLVAVELLDVEGDPVPPGTPSKQTLVTDLHKTSQPIVRYALNDILTVSPHLCSCGSSFRVIEQVQGRADDVFWGARADGHGLQFVFPDYIRRAIVVVGDRVEEYQVVQRSPDAVSVRLQVSQGGEDELLSTAVADGIRRVFQSYDCHLPAVEVEFGAVSANRESGKLIRIRRAFEV